MPTSASNRHPTARHHQLIPSAREGKNTNIVNNIGHLRRQRGMIRILALSLGIFFSITGCGQINENVRAELISLESSPIGLLGVKAGIRAKEFEVFVPADIDSLRITWEFQESDTANPRTICLLTPKFPKPKRKQDATRVVFAVVGDAGTVITPVTTNELTLFLYCNNEHASGKLKLPVAANGVSARDVYSAVSERPDLSMMLDEIRFSIPDNNGSNFAFNPNSGSNEIKFAPWKLRLYVRWANESTQSQAITDSPRKDSL